MMSKKSSRKFAPHAEPNVIPFIDVLLVLLIIFMVTAPRPTVDIPVDLPNRGMAPRIGSPTIVMLQRAGDGVRLFVDSEEVALDALGERTFAHVRSNNPDLALDDMYGEAHVLVRADQSAAYGYVVNVMDVLKRDGFARVGIFAEEAQET